MVQGTLEVLLVGAKGLDDTDFLGTSLLLLRSPIPFLFSPCHVDSCQELFYRSKDLWVGILVFVCFVKGV